MLKMQQKTYYLDLLRELSSAGEGNMLRFVFNSDNNVVIQSNSRRVRYNKFLSNIEPN